MGSGCVPVVINAGGQKEIVTDKKNGFLWSSLEELQKLTESLIKSPNTLKSISEKSKERAKDFGPDVFEEKIMQLIK